MSSLVMEIEDYELPAGQRVAVSRKATYFLLMTGSDVDVEFSYRGARIGGGKGLQGGDAVGPLTQPYDQVTLTSATDQTVKIATSSDPVTITRLSGVVEVNGIVKTQLLPDDSRQLFAIGAYAPAAASEDALVYLINPAGSGVELQVASVSVAPQGGDNQGFWGRMLAGHGVAIKETAYGFNASQTKSTGGIAVTTRDDALGNLEPDNRLGRFNAQQNSGTTLFKQTRAVIVEPGQAFIVVGSVAGIPLSVNLTWEEVAIV